LYGAGEILGSVGTWEGQNKTMVRDDGAVAQIAGNCAPIVDAKQLRKGGITGADHRLEQERGAIGKG